MLNMNSNIEELKALCDSLNGELSEVLVKVGNRHYVVGINAWTDCMDDVIYSVDSRYDIIFIDIESWYLLAA